MEGSSQPEIENNKILDPFFDEINLLKNQEIVTAHRTGNNIYIDLNSVIENKNNIINNFKTHYDNCDVYDNDNCEQKIARLIRSDKK